MIWPFNGKNTNGIRSAVPVAMLLLTNGISEHSPKSLTHIPVSSRNVFRWLRHWHRHCFFSLREPFDLRYLTAVLVDTSMHILSSHSVLSEWRINKIQTAVNHRDFTGLLRVLSICTMIKINNTFFELRSRLFERICKQYLWKNLSRSCIDFHKFV